MFFFVFYHKLMKGFNRMTAEVLRLSAEVAETKAAVEAALVEFKADISGLNDQIAALVLQLGDAAGDAAEVTRLADELDALQVEIAAAVAPAPTV